MAFNHHQGNVAQSRQTTQYEKKNLQRFSVLTS
jgi:hypothetical protein